MQIYCTHSRGLVESESKISTFIPKEKEQLIGACLAELHNLTLDRVNPSQRLWMYGGRFFVVVGQIPTMRIAIITINPTSEMYF